MKKDKTKIIPILLTAVLLCGLFTAFPMTAFTAQATYPFIPPTITSAASYSCAGESSFTFTAAGTGPFIWFVFGDLPYDVALVDNTLTIGYWADYGTYPLTVMCRSESNSGYAAEQEFTLTINSLPNKVTGITLDKTSLTLDIGEVGEIRRTIEPRSATNMGTTYSSSNPSVAQVNESGSILAVAQGTAIITATTDESGFTASCTVTVTNKIYEYKDPVTNRIAIWNGSGTASWEINPSWEELPPTQCLSEDSLV